MRKCVLLKKARKSIAKNCKLVLPGTVKKYALDKIQCLENVAHYLNTKIPDILVEIIDLQLCSSLKCDVLQKKGASRGGPCLKRWKL